MQSDSPGWGAAGRPEQLALATIGILRVLSFQQPVSDARTRGTAVELAAHLGCQCVHEVRHLGSGGGGPGDHAAPHVLEDLEERDAVRVDSRACGQLHDDPDQAVVDDQVRPCLLAGQFRAGGAQDQLRPALERLDLAV